MHFCPKIWPGSLAIAVLCLLGLPHLAVSAPQPENGNRRAAIELIVPKTQVRPGETIQVGVKFTMEPGWHIYWKNPGDAGEPPRFRWTLPGGGVGRAIRGSEWSATQPQFPVPIEWTDPGGIVGYGYEGTVIFPADVTIPGSATPGQTVELGIHADYLICESVCLPESGSAVVELTVGPDDGEGPSRQTQDALEQARQRLPTPAADVKAERGEDGRMTLSLPIPAGAQNVGFFPETPQGLVIEDISVQSEGGTARIQFRQRALRGATVEAGEFEAVVGYDTPQGRRGLTVSVPAAPAD